MCVARDWLEAYLKIETSPILNAVCPLEVTHPICKSNDFMKRLLQILRVGGTITMIPSYRRPFPL